MSVTHILNYNVFFLVAEGGVRAPSAPPLDPPLSILH